MYASRWNLRRGRAHGECSGEFQQPLGVKQQKESKILMLLPILREITSDRPSMCALLSLGKFFFFCSFESVLFWKYYKRDTSGVTLCHISILTPWLASTWKFPQQQQQHLYFLY